MTRDEAHARATRLAAAHFMCRGDATPRMIEGFVRRETLRLQGLPQDHDERSTQSSIEQHLLDILAGISS